MNEHAGCDRIQLNLQVEIDRLREELARVNDLLYTTQQTVGAYKSMWLRDQELIKMLKTVTTAAQMTIYETVRAANARGRAE